MRRNSVVGIVLGVKGTEGRGCLLESVVRRYWFGSFKCVRRGRGDAVARVCWMRDGGGLISGVGEGEGCCGESGVVVMVRFEGEMEGCAFVADNRV